jgi:hypothetical protein
VSTMSWRTALSSTRQHSCNLFALFVVCQLDTIRPTPPKGKCHVRAACCCTAPTRHAIVVGGWFLHFFGGVGGACGAPHKVLAPPHTHTRIKPIKFNGPPSARDWGNSPPPHTAGSRLDPGCVSWQTNPSYFSAARRFFSLRCDFFLLRTRNGHKCSRPREGAQENVREGNWTRDALCMTGACLGGIGHTPWGDSPETCGDLVSLRGDR